MFQVSQCVLLILLKVAFTNAYCYDSTYTSRSGTISVDHQGSGTCTKKIKLLNGKNWIKLSWMSFDVEGNMPTCKDYVKVYTGCSSPKLVAKFCSTNLLSKPHDIYSSDGCMKIVVYGASYKRNPSYRASYTSGSDRIGSSSCLSSSTKYGGSGVITSPSWPLDYSYSSIGYFGKCEWDIKRSSEELIQLNFMDVDISDSLFTTICSAPYLEVQGKSSVKTSYFPENRYCGTKDPFTTSTSYYKLEIKMKAQSYVSQNHRGFAVGWVAYKSDSSSKTVHTSTSNKTVIGGVIATVIILVVIISVIAGSRYRRARNVLATNYNSTATTNQVVVSQSNNTGGTNYPQQHLSQPGYQTESKPYPGAPPAYSELNTSSYPQAPPYVPPVEGAGYQPTAPGYPIAPQGAGFPPPATGYPQGAGYPPQSAGYPPQFAGYPPTPQGACYPPQGVGFQQQPQAVSYPPPDASYPEPK